MNGGTVHTISGPAGVLIFFTRAVTSNQDLA